MDTKSIALALAGTAGIVSLGLSSSSASAATAYNTAVLASNPSYYWTFDESGNADAVDLVGGNHLAASGTATRAVGTSTAGGVSLGNTASFDGSGGSLFSTADLGAPGASALSAYAIEFWAKLGTTNSTYLMSFDANSPAVINGYSGNGLELFGGDRSGASGPAVNSNWHHVVIGKSGTTHTFIIDNGSPITITTGGTINSIQQQSLFVGGSNLGDNTTAMLDELAVYDLSTSDYSSALSGIAAHYNVSAAPEPTALGLLGLAGLLGLRRRRNA